MQKQLKRTFAIYAAISVAVLGGATIAAARQGVVTFPLYQGGSGSVDLSSWGSGEAKEVDSKSIGERVMKKLRELDEVAYVRFASVYQSFEDLEDLKTVRDAVDYVHAKLEAGG